MVVEVFANESVRVVGRGQQLLVWLKRPLECYADLAELEDIVHAIVIKPQVTSLRLDLTHSAVGYGRIRTGAFRWLRRAQAHATVHVCLADARAAIPWRTAGFRVEVRGAAPTLVGGERGPALTLQAAPAFPVV